MSQENVEVIKATLTAMNREDWQAAFKGAGRDAEVDLTRAVGLYRSVYRIEQFRRLVEEWGKSWESVRYGADEFIDAGEHVVMPFTNRLLGRDGVEVQARGTWLFTFRDGVITRVCLYQELQEALEAAGLLE